MARKARCYCGASHLSFSQEPLQVVYCHCDDCRRWTGAAAAVLAAFDDDSVRGVETIGAPRSFAEGVQRWNCPECGSPMMGRFDYVPGQSWVPLGVIEDASDLTPEFHCFADRRHPWVDDAGLPGSNGSGRDTLNAAAQK
ncbi:MAG: GFA family protein [Litoreibacter sp.]|nr:GFA family protein [Litoreibacter sp.]MCY4336314.1 GFA family protein [Litoreibacter sp.]